jgi:hypothetical protein
LQGSPLFLKYPAQEGFCSDNCSFAKNKRREPQMKSNVCFAILLSLLVIATGCKKDENNPAGPTVVATEQWDFIMNNDTSNHDRMIYEKKSDATVSADAAWQVADQGETVQFQTERGVVIVLDTSISATIQGTATYSEAPDGYQNSPFTLTINGTAHNGVSSGAWIMTFSTSGWPSSLTGTFAATRSSGNGVTN